MPAGRPLTEAYVRLRPDLTGFREETEADLQRELGDAGIKVKVRADTTQADEDLGRWRQKQERTAPVQPKVIPQVDTREVNRLQERLDALGRSVTRVKIDADDKAGLAKIAAWEVRMAKLSETVARPDIDPQGLAKANADLLALDAELDRIGAKRETPTVSLNVSRPLADVGLLQSMILALAPAMVPVGASAIGLGAAMAGAFTAVGVGIGGAVGVIHGSSTIIKQDLQNIAKAQNAVATAKTPADQAKALQHLKDVTDAVTPAEKKLMDTQDALTVSWKNFVLGLMPAEVPAFQAFLKVAISLMTLLRPAIAGVFGVLAQLLNQFDRALKYNPQLQAFFRMLGTDAPKMVAAMGASIGNLAMGFIGLYTAFRPLTQQMTAGWVSMTAAFSKWAQALSGSSSFQAFVAYIQQTGPQVLSTLGALVDAFIAIAKAAAPFGPVTLELVRDFAQFITWLGKAHPLLLQIGVGMLIYGAAVSKVIGLGISLVKGVGTIIDVMKAARLAIIAFTGAETLAEAVSIGFTGALAAMGTAIDIALGPVGLIILAIAALIAAGILIYKNWGTIWPAMKAIFVAAWHGIETGFTAAWNGIKTGIDAFVGFFTHSIPDAINAVVDYIRQHWKILVLFAGPLGPVVFLFVHFWSQITAAAKAAWSVIQTIFTVAFKVIATVVKVGVALILVPLDLMYRLMRAGATLFWGWAGPYFRTAWRAIAAVLTTGLNALQAAWSAVWGTIRATSSAVWKGISSTATTTWRYIRSFLVTDLRALQAIWRAVWAAIQAVTSAVWAAIRAVVTTTWGIISRLIRAGLSALSSAWTIAWRGIRDVLTPIWRTIQGVVQAGWSVISGLFRTVGGTVSRLWSTLWSGVHATASSIWGVLQRGFSALWDHITSGIRTAVSAIGSAWNKVKDVFSSPIKWVIDHVWNDGLVKAWNDVAGLVHLPKLPTVQLAAGGTVGDGGTGGGGTRRGWIPQLASGGQVPVSPMVTNRPTAIVGEGNPQYPEFVIPTDPKYRDRAGSLYRILGAYLGSGFAAALPASTTVGLRAPGMATGGALSVGSILGSIGGGIKGAVTSAYSTVRDGAGKAVKLIRDGAAWGFNKAISPIRGTMNSFLGKGADLPGALDRMGNRMLDGALSLISGREKKQQASSGNTGRFAGSGSVHNWIVQALKVMGMSVSSALVNGIGSLIQSESGGNPNAINLWDSNAAAGHPSMGLMQTIMSTFKAYVWPALSGKSIFDPIANITAGVRYAIANYGLGMLLGGGRHTSGGKYEGYRRGGTVQAGRVVRVGEDGEELATFSRRAYIAPADKVQHGGTGGFDYDQFGRIIIGALAQAPQRPLVLQVDRRVMAKTVTDEQRANGWLK